jgi:hypothetical protein
MTAPTGFDYTQSLLPAADATIQPMKGGGSEAANFYTAFIGGLSLNDFSITKSDKTVILTNKKAAQRNALTKATPQKGGYVLQRRGKGM